ncbi:MAG: hypothetical protein GX852_00355 [Clostridiales bacterium]|jgi:two-component system phosphate regulon sensor histidine kinase PhoR|nr:hypothetical protein [Clostridiales bacterium]
MRKKNYKAIAEALIGGMLTIVVILSILIGGNNIIKAIESNIILSVGLLIVAVIVGLAMVVIISKSVTMSVSKAINEIDLDNPLQYIDKVDFREIAPLLKKMNDQQIDIQSDKAEIEKTSLIRQEFTTNVSHELKTPLHSISGYAEILENGLVQAEDVPVFAGKIRFEGQRLAQLVEDIIELSKLDGGAQGEPFEKLDLYEVAEDVISSIQMTAKEVDVNIHLEGEKSEMMGIHYILHSIIYNLCDNAIKYNRQGGYIYVTVRQIGTSIKLVVSDTGIGIPEEDVDRVFERFFRVDKSRSKAVGGTGLGLSIVKHGARTHNATIDVKSTPGEGTTFTFMFPVNPANE